MKKNFQCFLVFWLYLALFNIPFNAPIEAQNSPNPYKLKWQIDVPVTVIGIGGVGLSEWMKNKKVHLTPDEIALLSIESIPRFDRYAARVWSPPAQKVSDVLLYTSVALPVLLLADPDMRKHTPKLALIGLETYLINAALTGLTKEIIQRKRPYVYNPNAPMHKKTAADATSSFFSGHTSASAAATFMAAKMYADYHPNSKYKPYLWAGAALFPAITGYLRVRGGKHYLTDVITGYAVGALVGVLVPHFHKWD